MGELCALWRLMWYLVVSGRIPEGHAILDIYSFSDSRKNRICCIIRIRPIVGFDIVVRFIVGLVSLLLRSNIHVV
jgi:hypothetical protein